MAKMKSSKQITTKKILDELRFHDYISRSKENKRVLSACRKVLNTQASKTYNQAKEREQTLDFIQALWGKFDCEQVAEKFDNFVKIEQALYGLERDKEKGGRYRDHFVHMFNTFIFGLRIISNLFGKVNEDEGKELFKVENEDLVSVGLPFSSNYNYKQRTFYLWMLISTFHDIAIPFQHMPKIGEGITRFVEEFGWVVSEPILTMSNFDSSQLYYYFTMLSEIYNSKLKLAEDGNRYERDLVNISKSYVAKTLGRAFDRREHGALSGFFMLKTIEEIFLLGLSKRYRDKIGLKNFDIYDEYVLQQDIARAALAISLHTLTKKKETGHPEIVPIKFDEYPLTFLLILSDELQEYHRHEGGTILGNTKFRCQPKISLSYKKKNIDLNVAFSLNKKEEKYFIEEANAIESKKHNGKKINDVEKAAKVIMGSICDNLVEKIILNEKFKLEIKLCKSTGDTIFEQVINTKTKD
ncbi:MAG: hypothetical protein A2173_07970 [Planctomycetes bacterium RBG_13_44_8b]|nr:MAG: hypothetical protein A2173_07970 [Planctomycetes bacterium RBG_13_44_8b]